MINENNIMPTLATNQYCVGCTACASSCPQKCISMIPDDYGFLYPYVDGNKCKKCGVCETVCPLLHTRKHTNYERTAFAAYSKDDYIRANSSSGGIFTEIARSVIQRGGVVFGAAYGDSFNVVHICVDNESELDKLRGAKYSQSDLNNTFQNIRDRLSNRQLVLFTGTPCQVAGLKSFLNKEYDNLLTIDFVCHSVPSPLAWSQYLQYRAEMDNCGELPKDINLRSKLTGWSHYQYSNELVYGDSNVYSVKSNESLYMRLFVDGYISRKSCENCKFKGYSRVSDITLGDFWGIWDIAPEMDDDKGTSVVLIQSARGAEIIENIKDKLVVEAVTLEDAAKYNQAMLKVAQPTEYRTEVLACIKKGDFNKCEKLISVQKNGIIKKIIKRIMLYKKS